MTYQDTLRDQALETLRNEGIVGVVRRLRRGAELFLNPPDVDEAQAYWRGAYGANAPAEYLEHPERSTYLIGMFHRLGIPKEASILEVGSNVGRNLAFLRDAGYSDLSGVEINPDAVELMHEVYPELQGMVEVGDAASVLAGMNRSYDIVFTMAVLRHIHPNDTGVFDGIIQATDGYLITIESVGAHGRTTFHHDYTELFSGFNLVLDEPAFGRYRTRIFDCAIQE